MYSELLLYILGVHIKDQRWSSVVQCITRTSKQSVDLYNKNIAVYLLVYDASGHRISIAGKCVLYTGTRILEISLKLQIKYPNDWIKASGNSNLKFICSWKLHLQTTIWSNIQFVRIIICKWNNRNITIWTNRTTINDDCIFPCWSNDGCTPKTCFTKQTLAIRDIRSFYLRINRIMHTHISL